ncbi:hypothetical protein C5Y96_16500 [Blastopirellula marina]|uniref:Uncharacterized protein n=1 Tax=Blastopirellula marina TaxID=124 RepID=A0A2S8F742_9BACT|nr:MULTISPECIES: hypothetical protein [Pirellulaceae]PQO27977.1 hypothetical protein C5Y96_16500 [Blastopirellula marina]RCS48402.1 hypothetical protein DTL36_16520 [Bremerella cremea]
MARWKTYRFHLGSPLAGFSIRMALPILSWSWFQMRISTLLMLVLLVSVAIAWRRDRNDLADQIIDLEVELARARGVKTSWGVEQLYGEPNTKNFGDYGTAWASATPDGQDEWVIAQFENAVTPSELRIHETYNPGAVNKVSIFTPLGNELVVWKGVDPTPQGSGGGVSKIPLATIWQTKKVKIYLDSKNVRGWNEIDAIGLVDQGGEVQWTRHAEASSIYGSRYGLITVF